MNQIFRIITLNFLFFAWQQYNFAQEKLYPLNYNPAYQGMDNLEKGFKQSFPELCLEGEKPFMQFSNINSPASCANNKNDGNFTVELVNGNQSLYHFHISSPYNDIVSITVNDINDNKFAFTDLKAGPYIVEITEVATGKVYKDYFALDDENTNPLNEEDWLPNLKPAFCNKPGSLSKPGTIAADLTFYIYNALDASLVDSIKADKSAVLPGGTYFMISFGKGEFIKCQSFLMFDVPELPSIHFFEEGYFEDFSTSLVYPDPENWIDKDAYVNHTYGLNPVNIGVATLDGLNQNGQAYTSSTGTELIDGQGDYLTSQPFCLDMEDLPVTKVDSLQRLYISFYYQQQGYGDFPNEFDSLILEVYAPDTFTVDIPDTTFQEGYYITFVNPQNLFDTIKVNVYEDQIINTLTDNDFLVYTNEDGEKIFVDKNNEATSIVDSTFIIDIDFSEKTVGGLFWQPIWFTTGADEEQTEQKFTRVDAFFKGTSAFYDGFQYRFRNTATISGNNDHWHIDYIRIDTTFAKTEFVGYNMFVDTTEVTTLFNENTNEYCVPVNGNCEPIKYCYEDNGQVICVVFLDKEIYNEPPGINAIKIENAYEDYVDQVPFEEGSEDVTTVEVLPSIFQQYSAMPWSHFAYENNWQTWGNNDFNYIIKNLTSLQAFNTNLQFSVSEACGGLVIYSSNQNITVNESAQPNIFFTGINTGGDSGIGWEMFIDGQSEDTEGIILENKFVLAAGNDNINRNDTLYRYQRLLNYYAYDDGSAEKAYGLFGKNAKMALKYDIAKADSLTGLQIHFANMNANTSFLEFRIFVWTDLQEGTNSGTELYGSETSLLTPVLQADTINGFITYPLDQALYIPEEVKSIYVGIEQINDKYLNVGFDRNTNTNEHLLINYAGQWEPSIFDGTLMIRPVFGNNSFEDQLAGIDDKEADATIKVYPNPVNGTLFVDVAEQNYAGVYYVQIFDFAGRQILNEQLINRQIETGHFSNGIYLLKVFNEDKEEIGVKKLVKQ